MSRSFFGGIHPDDGKRLSAGVAIEVLPAPAQVVLPLSMHIGAPCAPLVQKGDRVLLGQKIGDSQAPVSAPVHATVSGTVLAVEERLHPNGKEMLSVVIENDGLDTLCETVKPHTDIAGDPDALLALIKESGIVGMGGAAFPAHMKISSALGKVDTLIINAAECEPYITADYRILLEETDAFLAGVRYLLCALSLPKAVIGIEANKPLAIQALQAKLAGASDIELRVLKARYPQGSEKQLIQAVTGRQVPPGGLPASVGCVVFNVYTSWCVNRAVAQGIPAIDRIVTVSGPGILTPKNFRVRVGTPVSALIEAAGGLCDDVEKILLGGPMMGNAIYNTDVPVIKGTNAVLALPRRMDATVANPTCIRCGKCVSVCPMHLLPIYMYAYERKNDLDMLQKLNVTDCMECGSCTYICPGRLHLVQSFKTAKVKLNALKAAKSKAV